MRIPEAFALRQYLHGTFLKHLKNISNLDRVALPTRGTDNGLADERASF